MSANIDLKALAKESVWSEKYRYTDAERDYHSNNDGTDCLKNPLADRLKHLEVENQSLKKTVNDLSCLVSKLELRVSSLEGTPKPSAPTAKVVPKVTETNAKKCEDNDSDIDLFGSDDDEEADEVRKKRLEEYANKKSKKPGVIAKSSVVLDVKPWDDETDMKEMEKKVRQITMDGLVWGASKLVPLAYGIQKLQIVIVIEDDKVSVEELTETIESIEDFVQSVDIAAFNKI